MKMKIYEEKDINAFLTSTKAVTIMKTAKIGKTRYYRLKNDPEFQRIVTQRRNDIVREAVMKMESYLCKDVEILQQLIEDPETKDQVKVNAIQCMLSQLGQWKTYTEIIERLERLEADGNRFRTL